MPEEKKLTLKQARWLDVYIETGNATEAAMRAYELEDRAIAGQIGYENMKKLDISELMDSMGLTEHKLILKVQEGLDATRSISAIAGTEANGGTVDFVDVPDYAVRHKYLETSLKLKGKLQKDSSTNIQINNVIPILGGNTDVSGHNSNQEVVETH